MKAEITVELDNAAFEGDLAGPELERILKILASKLWSQTRETLPRWDGTKLRDVNGNTVGELRIHGED